MSEHEEGRELDAHVAEKLMGWRRVPPRYSTDIAAAWEVLEKLDAMGLKVEVGNRVEGARGGGWFAAVTRWGGKECEECGSPYVVEDVSAAPTAPLAICRAALAVPKAD